MIFVMIMFEDREEAAEFIAECREEDIPAGIILDLEQWDTRQVMQ